MYKGQAQNDLGIRTDILNNVDKKTGIEMLIRSMAPKIIVCDEIGNKSDIKSINYALCSGVKGIFTAHGDSLEYLNQNSIFKEMLDLNLFDRIIILDKYNKGKFSQIYDTNIKSEGKQ